MYDIVVKGARVVRPNRPEVETLDLAISDGKFVCVAPDIDPTEARQTVDARGRLAFPGVVDAHMHFGIYNPLDEDIAAESRAAATGGVTTALSYMRTGRYYLNRSGPYAEFFPQVLEASDGRSYVDYAYHLAPMMRRHIDEIEELAAGCGVTSFKIFMFYGGHGLHGRSDDQASFLMTPSGERYDYGHFEFVMRGIAEAAARRPELGPYLSLSLHCETAEIMAAYTRLVEARDDLHGLAAYHEARPPHSEGLAIVIASYLAHETRCANINLLHLSSAKAIDAALRMAETFPEIDFRREVTVGHLLTDIDSANGVYGKVNPPIRPREDVEALWDAVLAGKVDWIVSDHACCRKEMKVDPHQPDEIFLAKSGFGGTEYLLPGVLTEGLRRGLSLSDAARLLCWNPAQRYGLLTKGTIAEGYDADFSLVDDRRSWTVRAAESESTQGYTPFEGLEMTVRVDDVYLRGARIVADGRVVGEPMGRYLARPIR